MIETALKIARQWKWSAEKASQLVVDMKRYYAGKSPFSGGKQDARDWWEAVPTEGHNGIRTLAIALASIVPHSAEVEHLFSDLGGIQTPRRNQMTVANMEKTGKIRSRLSYDLYLRARVEGKSVHRKHNHMHTSETPGIDAKLAKGLENPISWIPPLDAADDNDPTEDIVERATEELQRALEDEAPAPLSPGSVIDGDVVDNGKSAEMYEDSIDIVGGDAAAAWSIEELMQK
ncbi:hypothetical protein B0H10DRAFT_1947685 [Mycena sp. CBHHK59/15]|nr:hypothetical protein B0H10DRAFT_1947685 [Mycena sp. CBHHK59/15]